MKQSRARQDSEDGSLVAVLLIVIILGGVIAALFTSVQTSGITARVDRDFHQAVQIADAGVQQGFVVFRDMEAAAVPSACTPAAGYAAPTETVGHCAGTVDQSGEGSFVWRYEHLGGQRWRVTSEGTYRGASRTVEADLGPQQLFDVAILAKQWLTYNGGGTGPSDPFVVGTFGTITANGAAVNHLKGIVLYGSGPHTFPNGFANVSNGGNPAIPNIAAEAFEPGGPCEDGVDGEVYPADFMSGPGPFARGEVYCAGSIDFDNGTHVIPDSPGADPVTVYVDGVGTSALSIKGSGKANFPSMAAANPANLLVYVAGGDVTISGNASLAAAIWAPASSCTSNGGTDFKGAMVCNTVTLNGNFDYGEEVSGITDGEFTVNNWQERVATGGL
jgi:hypothetical protein